MSKKPEPNIPCKEPLIPLRATTPHYLTVAEYESVEREVNARAMAGDVTLGDFILLRLLDDNRHRYLEIKPKGK